LVKIKICGITRSKDAEFLNTFPIDYIGFILYPPSPRFVGDKLEELLKYAPSIKKVAVFVDPEYEEVKKALALGIDLVQLHGKEPLSLARKIGLHRVIKAFRVKEDFKISLLNEWREAYAILLDTYKPGVPGGTGEVFNWEIARKVVRAGFKVFLAGGISPKNVKKAVNSVEPYAIDVSSGVEKDPGIKDHEKIKELIKEIRG